MVWHVMVRPSFRCNKITHLLRTQFDRKKYRFHLVINKFILRSAPMRHVRSTSKSIEIESTAKVMVSKEV